jgi:hypothetical protein
MNTHQYRCPLTAGDIIRRAALLILALVTIGGTPVSVADRGPNHDFTVRSLRGTWVWTGFLRFAAPIPIPRTIIDGAPPHDVVAPGDVVGLWASTVGLMTFDGKGSIEHAEEVGKAGEVIPQAGLPFEYLPPFSEVYTGNYTVSEHGVVEISLTGRDLSSPEGQVDFEYDLHCVLNRWPMEMDCVPARFETYIVDPTGFAAPITGTMGLKRRY